MLCLSGNMFAQKSIFDQYSDMDDVTTIYISKSMFDKMRGGKTAGVNISKIKDKLKSMRIITTENRKVVESLRKDMKVFRDKNTDFTELMRIKDGKDSTYILAYQQGNFIKNMLVVVEEANEMTIIQFLGNFTMQDIQDIK